MIAFSGNCDACNVTNYKYELAELGAFHLGQQTEKYLDDRTAESFKRQLDLEESIWRSAPLIVTGLAAHAATLGWASHRLPPFTIRLIPIAAYVLLLCSTLLFAWAFRWLWEMIRKRDFVYLPRDELIASYAAELVTFHSGQGLSGDALDEQVLQDLRGYMTASFGQAATSTFENNQIRAAARSQALASLMMGFVMVFLCISVIIAFKMTSKISPAPTKVAPHAIQSAPPTPSPQQAVRAPIPSTPTDNSGRRIAHQIQHGS